MEQKYGGGSLHSLAVPSCGGFPVGGGTGATYAPVPKVTLMVIPVEAEAKQYKAKAGGQKKRVVYFHNVNVSIDMADLGKMLLLKHVIDRGLGKSRFGGV